MQNAKKQILVKMNNKTRSKIENSPKTSKLAYDKLYAFAMDNLGEKGYALFSFDDEMSDNEVLFNYNDITETIKIK